LRDAAVSNLIEYSTILQEKRAIIVMGL
jgi:hypothetical protein